MKTKLIKFFNLIKKDKQAKILTIMGIILLFIFTLGYSLSMFTSNQNKKIANIKVNNLSFNITTNSGEKNDRILHLQAGKLEQFNIILTNLNKIDVKYEFTYELCNNQNCTSTSNDIPTNLLVYKENDETSIYGILEPTKSNSIRIITKNNSNNDYYIKLNINAGYSWNELDLANQIEEAYTIKTELIAYVDGIEKQEYPKNCNYSVNAKAYKNNIEIMLDDLTIQCDKETKKWKTSYTDFADKIEFYFTSFKSKNLVDYIKELFNTNSTSNNLFKEDPDSNIRYVGGLSQNYIEFGNENELWRIIGIFKVLDVNDNTTKEMVKIVRNSSIGKYSWDTTIWSDNEGYGYNNWNKSKIKEELNGDYLNYNLTSNTTWYSGVNNSKGATFNYTYTIKEKYQNYIANVRWNLGGHNTYGSSASEIYNSERSSTVYSGNSTTWDGKVGLLYPSDVAYSSNDNTCRNTISKCSTLIATNWMNDNASIWLMTHISTISNYAYVYSNGISGSPMVFNKYDIKPSLYLKNNTQIITGDGSKESPYVISFE